MADDIPSHNDPPNHGPIVIGIGASAGGLASLRQFFSNTPGDTGLAFVIVVHLSPEHPSFLSDLLQTHCAIPVSQVTETVAFEPNRVYVIPPGSYLSSIDSHLNLSDVESTRRPRFPIDHFLGTLAVTHGTGAVGVILSGTGSDGSEGLKRIKESGGLTIVEDPGEAEYDGMPQSAIATGLIDLVLPVAEIPARIVQFLADRPTAASGAAEGDLAGGERYELTNIFSEIKSRTGHDFSRYKASTVVRRIRRRMQQRQIGSIPDYVRFLREVPEENQALIDELLINVTNFFRDPEVFERVERDILPRIFDVAGRENPIRIWSVGCATGEEAYSFAILLMEYAATIPNPPPLQIFATDLHEQSLGRAREGFYPESIEAHVSPERLRRFFIPEAGGYRVRKEVRDIIVFAAHNILKDPPFSRIDLIACRNLMIYLNRDIQEDLVQIFHYALVRDAFLILGTSETIEPSERFRVEHKKLCIYQRRNFPAKEPRLQVFPYVYQKSPGAPTYSQSPAHASAPSHGAMHQKMVERYAPPSVLLNQDLNIVHLSEHVGKYLAQPGGEPTNNIFRRIRDELKIELRSALNSAQQGRQISHAMPVDLAIGGSTVRTLLRLRPAGDPELEGYWLLIFDDIDLLDGVPANGSSAADGVIRREMEAEIDLVRKRLQTVVEEYETSQESMRAANEELQSANEELRSTMEELETSKEELQSMNEELQTVNQENKHKVEELSQLYGDLHNLLTATDIATLFLDRNLKILRFTPRTGELFNVRVTDRGRPLADLTNRLGYEDLITDATKVLNRLAPMEREVRAENGYWYLTRLLPYRSSEDRIEGVVITFVDISEMKRAQEALQNSQQVLSQELAALRALHVMTSRVVDSRTRAEALQALIVPVMEMQSADFGTIQLLIPRDSTHFEIGAQVGFKEDHLASFKSEVATDYSSCGRAFRDRRGVLIPDIMADPDCESYRPFAALAGYRAVQSAPLVGNDGSVIGVLSTYFREPRAFSDRDGQLLEQVAQQATNLIERMRILEEIGDRNSELISINRELEQFAYAASHDLQEPLRMINVYTELLADKCRVEDDEEVAKYTEYVRLGVRRMEALLRGLLDYSKLLHGDELLAPTDLNASLRAATLLLEHPIRDSGASITFSGLPTVLADEELLTTIFQNLLSNSLKYRNALVPPRISIAAERSGDNWRIAFTDNGIGFAPQYSEIIFGLFKRLHKGDYAGTGLGLAIVRHALERMGGAILASSKGEGQGATFTFTLRGVGE